MSELPLEAELQTEFLSSCFNETTNAYKFYWFWAILEHINENESLSITLDDLSLRMLSLAWYPLDFYKLSFGKQDSFKPLAELISKNILVDHKPNAPSLFARLNSNLSDKLTTNLKVNINLTLKRWVAYRFLRPFFANELSGIKDQFINEEISKLASIKKGFAPYYLEKDKIILDEKWRMYFVKHQNILRGFIKWHLLKFLQKNNPNVIGLSEKLEKPSLRNLNLAKKYWQNYLIENPTQCIYSNVTLNSKDISLDHFIPWSYVVHDQIWNIIPTTKSINSKKGNSLPDLRYLEKYCELHFSALTFHLKRGSNGLIEDFYSITNSQKLLNLSYPVFKEKLSFEVNTHLRNAKNLGFSNEFKY